MKTRSATGAVIVLLAAGAVGQPAQPPAVEIADHQVGWSLALPPGWREASAPSFDATVKLLKSSAPDANFRFTHAFCKTADGTLGDPYIIVQVTDAHSSGMSFEDIEKAFNAQTVEHGLQQAEELIGQGIKGAVTSRPLLDRSRACLFTSIDIDSPGAPEKVRGMLWTFIGADHQVQLNCYTAASSVDASAPEFQTIASSFSFVPGRSFQPGSGMSPILRNALIGAGIGAALGAVTYLFRRLKGAGSA